MRFVVISDTHFATANAAQDGVWWNRTLKSRLPERRNEWVAGPESDRTFAISIPRIT